MHECQGCSKDAQGVKVELHLRDAVYRELGGVSGPPERDHPLGPTGRQFDTILALDCAYHFRTRQIFLEQCFSHLSPGGRIALADICFSDDRPPSTFMRSLLGLLGLMPLPNIITQQEYLRCMVNIGYEDVSLEDVSAHVFPGFMRFLQKRGFGWRIFVTVLNAMLVTKGARFVIITGSKPGLP